MNNLFAVLFTTRFQLRFLQWIAFPVLFWLKFTRNNTVIKARREGVLWELDLAEAIDLCIWMRCYELDLNAALKQQLSPGKIILDIGANRGAHTMLMAKLVGQTGHIHAIEATAWGVEKINRALELNPELKSRVTIHHLFLLAPGEYAPHSVSASWSIGEKIAHPDRNNLDQGFALPLGSASALTLDQWVVKESIKQIDFIKMDVDGNEVSVLAGATSTLQDLSPVIFMELSPIHYQGHKHSFADQVHMVQKNGYGLYSLNKTKKLPVLSCDLEQMIPLGVLVNVLALKDGGTNVIN